MAELTTAANLAAPDDFYEQLVAAHHGLSETQSALVNAKLVLLLANHIGDAAVLAQAIAAACEDIAPDARNPQSTGTATSSAAGNRIR